MTEELLLALKTLAGPPATLTANGWSQTGAGPYVSDADLDALVALGYAEKGEVWGETMARITKAGREALRPGAQEG